jgi:hypothetical protein
MLLPLLIDTPLHAETTLSSFAGTATLGKDADKSRVFIAAWAGHGPLMCPSLGPHGPMRVNFILAFRSAVVYQCDKHVHVGLLFHIVAYMHERVRTCMM